MLYVSKENGCCGGPAKDSERKVHSSLPRYVMPERNRDECKGSRGISRRNHLTVETEVF